MVEHVKRLRHKRGELTMSIIRLSLPTSHLTSWIISAEVNSGKLSEELHQYVMDDKPSVGLHRIKLDGPPNAYTPPSSLTVHLSKIPMPELRPHPSPSPRPSSPSPRNSSASSLPSTSSPRLSPPPWPQVRTSSAPVAAPVATAATQQPQQHQSTGLASLLWGQPRKRQH